VLRSPVAEVSRWQGRKEGGEDDVEVEQIASSEIEGCCIADRWVFEIEVGERFRSVWVVRDFLGVLLRLEP
jgi:hypothetical protein